MAQPWAQQRLCLSQIACTPSLLFPVWALQPGLDGGPSLGTTAASPRPQTKTEAAHRVHSRTPLSHRGPEGSGRGHSIRVSKSDRAARDRDGDRETERYVDQPKRDSETPREEETERALRWAQTSV